MILKKVGQHKLSGQEINKKVMRNWTIKLLINPILLLITLVKPQDLESTKIEMIQAILFLRMM